ncbi:cupredoxin domain-containing protein [Candidatus Methylocalor cossyra]|uniref:Cupredoxin_1 domain-containing protein n=1 Tax=Candidatus Methylocalor cossyra TaxID=3108543 RepID=A0ABM9NMV5_9GAMM
MTSRRNRSLLTFVGAAILWYFAAITPSTATAGSPDPARITVEGFMFNPMALTVKAGSTVIWTNMDDDPHTVISDTGLFRSGAMDTNDSFSFKFDKPGTYRFICSIHPRMVGTIVVQ